LGVSSEKIFSMVVVRSLFSLSFWHIFLVWAHHLGTQVWMGDESRIRALWGSQDDPARFMGNTDMVLRASGNTLAFVCHRIIGCVPLKDRRINIW
jgi:hypothetical protein